MRTTALADQGPAPAQSNGEANWVQEIESAGRTHNLVASEAILQGFDHRREQDPERYAILVESALGILNTHVTEQDRLNLIRIEQRYVLAALDQPERISALVELALVLRLKVNLASVPANVEEIQKKLNLIMHAWRRMEEETRPDFDFSDEPTMDVAPPRGSTRLAISGIDQRLIADAKLRAEYQAAIARNNAKAAEFVRQRRLRDLKGPLIVNAEACLTSALQVGAISDQEVLSYLAPIKDDGAKSAVIEKVLSHRKDE